MRNNNIIITSILFFSILLFNFNTSVINSSKNFVDEKVCFEFESETFSNSIEIYFLENNQVKGEWNVYVHDEEMGYETTSYMEFTGELSGEDLRVDMTIEIEDNLEEDSRVWKYKGDKIIMESDVYIKVDCEKFEE